MKTKLIFGILFLSLSADYLCQNQELRIFFEEGIPEQKAALCGVYFHGDKRMPYLIYSNNGTHGLFQAAQDVVVIQYFKLYNVENEDISNQIQLIDERKIHTGIFSENNLELNYYIESCY
jgi:hypothetical protein